MEPSGLANLIGMLRSSHSRAQDDKPLHRLSQDFFTSNWQEAQDLLCRTTLLRAFPLPLPGAPRHFLFEMDLVYKRQCEDGSVELAGPPVQGEIIYNPNVFASGDEPTVIAMVDRALGYFHPNVGAFGQICLGELPPGPMSLRGLLEHLWSILSYQNRTPSHPLSLEASTYFALNPEAMTGLDAPPPLY